MKSFLKTILASVALAAPAFAVQDKCPIEEPCIKYKNRLSVSPTSVGFERLNDEGFSYGFEYSESPAFFAKNRDTTMSVTSAKIGYTVSIDPRSRITPAVGATMFRDEGTSTIFTKFMDMNGTSAEAKVLIHNPFFFHATAGFGAEYDVMRALTVGLNVHGMAGQIWGGTIEQIGDVSWGLNMSLPLTYRFGGACQWDARFEPFTYLLKDYANYVGGKAALGYRF